MKNDVNLEENSLLSEEDLGTVIKSFPSPNYEEDPNFIKLYSIYDKTAKMFGQPMVSLNDDVIKRNLKLDVCKDKNSMYYTEADCFSLCKIGYLNILNGTLVPFNRLVIDFKDLINTDNYKL